MIGQTISQYKITRKLGEGGMGEVFLAEDARLDRTVALKFLPPGMAQAPDIKARFIQEAKAASALKHPNVCTIHDIQEHEGRMFIVMEHVEGTTLAEKKGQLSIKKAVDIAAQVADGLAAAHEKGIVHRDIKAENIMLRDDGLAQIMDFGLAKLRGVSRLTKEGSTVGTTAYMSPEALQGHDTDHRTDIYSLGVVLFELVTGRLPFDAIHETAVMYEIVNVDAPPPSAVRADVDPELDRIVLECLDKEPDERYQSARELAKDLRRFNRTSSGRKRASQVSTIKPVYQQPQAMAPAAYQSAVHTSAVQPGTAQPLVAPPRTSKLPWLVAAVAVAAAVVLAFMQFGRPAPARNVSRSIIMAPDSTSFASWGGGHLAISPDGKRLAFVAADSSVRDNRLWVRAINSLSALPLPGTEGAFYPFWSTDSRYIAFFAGGKLKKIDASGGPPLTLCDAVGGTGRAGSWNAEDVVIFTPSQDGIICRVPAAGGTPESLTVRDTVAHDYTHRWPWFLPDGNRFLYFARTVSDAGGEGDAICVGSLDGRTHKRLLRARSNAAFASGHLLFMRDGTLMAQPFDDRALEFTGDAFPVVEDVSFNQSFSRGSFSVSQNGLLVYQIGALAVGSRLRLYGRDGQVIDSVVDQETFYSPVLSPDGKRVAVDILDPSSNNVDIWIYDVERRIRTRFTFDSAAESNPVWSPDGQWIAYRWQRNSDNGPRGIYMRSSSGAGLDSLLLATDTLVRPTRWSADGRYLMLEADAAGQADVWALPLAGGDGPDRLLTSSFWEYDAAISPDGRWLAYTSNESGQDEVYVIPFGRRGGKWQVSLDDGDRPRWRADAKEVFYLDADDNIVVAQVDGTGDSFRIGEVKHLFAIRGQRPGKVFDVSGDGSTFLVNAMTAEARVSTATLVINWDEELKKR
jgi:serine/threonine protein kinase